MVNSSQYKELVRQAELLKALAHPIRLCIVKNLIRLGSCNVSTMQGGLAIPQSTVSQHLSKLKAAGVIEGERHGVEVNYKIASDSILNLIESLE
ncbi:transcriptional regulator, ArsR family [Desulfonispora thiosulfatigenes DSM 11270]|uniref:Transcriptional regulator, ArsR family n=1 Tax=Desulfonispora thiosulfatigenes DSM 11270 TaxID=656914 RepID=A0A1W1VS71_DESTI|nr:metalloregulator ArsR/SmtB family transcription factor [Desulfonispora thiosulfatigenes]SMB96222.1 transcriptional regulator, ArsR family [Desulfonispora thiosulfatigenes DSM 11270]